MNAKSINLFDLRPVWHARQKLAKKTAAIAIAYALSCFRPNRVRHWLHYSWIVKSIVPDFRLHKHSERTRKTIIQVCGFRVMNCPVFTPETYVKLVVSLPPCLKNANLIIFTN